MSPCAEKAAAETNALLKLRFSTNAVGETVVKHGEEQKVLNVSQASTNKGAQYSLIPEAATVALSSEQFPGWGVELPPKQTASFGFDYTRRMLRLATVEGNQDLVRLSFPDGATALMDANAEGRLELMDDGTYAFFGAGAVTGTNADGVAVRFGNVFPPMFGGRLMAPSSTNATARFSRSSPVIQLTLVGQIDQGVAAKIGDQLVKLEAGATKEVTAANGAMIALRLNPETRSLEYTVQRGLFRINVDSFRCWKTLATSGQSAAMQWDTNGFLLELKNKNGPGAFQQTMLVNLNSSLNVALGDSATFQYGRVGDCSTFLAAANGGNTTLYNAQNGQYVRLDAGNMNIVAGSPDTVPVAAATRAPVRLNWSSDEQVELKGVDNTGCVVGVNEETTLASGGADLYVAYGGKDKLTLRTDSGAVAVTPEFMSNISIEFGEGAAVTMGYDRGSDIFRVTPDPANMSAVGLRTPTGYFPSITPGSQVSFVINRSNFGAGNADGALIFSETAGAGVGGGAASSPGITVRTLPSGRGDSSILSTTSQVLDVSRIQQPPVTSSE